MRRFGLVNFRDFTDRIAIVRYDLHAKQLVIVKLAFITRRDFFDRNQQVLITELVHRIAIGKADELHKHTALEITNRFNGQRSGFRIELAMLITNEQLAPRRIHVADAIGERPYEQLTFSSVRLGYMPYY